MTFLQCIFIVCILMMYSGPDTPFGKALGQFLRLFEQRPLELATLHTAFADLAALAARDHPDMPWPMKMNEADGRNATFTVEELLGSMRELYVNQPTVDAVAVGKELLVWHGAKVQDVVAHGGLTPSLQINFSQRTDVGSREIRTELLGTLAADCAWKLLQAQEILGASTDASPGAGGGLSKALKGATVLDTAFGSEGVLMITFSKNILLELRPDAFSIKPDYLLILAEDIYSHFNGGFIAEKLNFIAEDDETTTARPAS